MGNGALVSTCYFQKDLFILPFHQASDTFKGIGKVHQMGSAVIWISLFLKQNSSKCSPTHLKEICYAGGIYNKISKITLGSRVTNSVLNLVTEKSPEDV